MKETTMIFCLFVSFSACCQRGVLEIAQFAVDENIREEVEARISESEYGESFTSMFLVYENTVIVDSYENDSLFMTATGEEQKMLFKSFFYTLNDTIVIDGSFGLFGSIGFSIKFIDDKPIVYHLLTGDDFPVYSMTREGNLQFRIEVPCKNTRVVLSKIPELKEEEVIYGFVAFESDDYFQSSSAIDGNEKEERKKISMNMQVYFKAKFLDIERMK